MDKEAAINQLKFSIQALSLEAEDQIAAFPDFVVVTDELLEEFGNWYRVATGNFPEYFSEEQIKILRKIYEFIDCIPPEDENMSIAEELRTSDFWKNLRILSNEALEKLGWTSEIPPDNRVTYIKG